MGEIAQALLVQAPHVTREIRGLEERGLVRTVREPGDHRARRIAVTQDGREVVERAEEAGFYAGSTTPCTVSPRTS